VLLSENAGGLSAGWRWYSGIGMKTRGIARKMARQAGVSEGEAADRLAGVVREILGRLRSGWEADRPGLGRLTAGRDGKVSFERDRGGRHD
jgi:hypothetical protein